MKSTPQSFAADLLNYGGETTQESRGNVSRLKETCAASIKVMKIISIVCLYSELPAGIYG